METCAARPRARARLTRQRDTALGKAGSYYFITIGVGDICGADAQVGTGCKARCLTHLKVR